MTILHNGRLHEDSLHEARILIAETIQTTVLSDNKIPDERLRGKSPNEFKLNIMHAWKLIEQMAQDADQHLHDDFLVVANEWIDDGTWEFPTTIEQFED